MKPIVVVPAYNEAPTVGDVVAGARRHATVVVVDDGSTDATGAVGRAAGADVIRHRTRLGKGQALRSGIAAARARGATHVVTLDGDGQHDPNDLTVVLAAMHRQPNALVIGRRTGVSNGGLPRARGHAIRVAGFFTNWASGRYVTDTQSGFRVYPLALFEDVHPRAGGFVFETEVLLAAALQGWDVVEVDIRTIPRAARRSRFRPLLDGAAIGTYIAKRVAARWAAELGAGVGEATAFARGDRRRIRHAEVLAEAARHADVPAQWALTIGVANLQRAAACLESWWRHPRLRRAGVAAGATLATPLLVVAALAQALVPSRRMDVVGPLVERIYSQTRLGSL